MFSSLTARKIIRLTIGFDGCRVYHKATNARSIEITKSVSPQTNMGQPTSDDLDKALRDADFKKDTNDDYYYRIKDGRTEKRYADGDHSQSSENDYRHEKHQSGNNY